MSVAVTASKSARERVCMLFPQTFFEKIVKKYAQIISVV